MTWERGFPQIQQNSNMSWKSKISKRPSEIASKVRHSRNRDAEPQQDKVSRSRAPGRMKVLPAVLLALLLCRQPGRGRAQDEDNDDYFGYDEDDEDDKDDKDDKDDEDDREDEAGSGGRESGPWTTYSGWCADTCKPSTREVAEILMTTTCCQTTLCNTPPWQGLPARGAGDPPGSPETVAAAFLFSLLTGLWAMAS